MIVNGWAVTSNNMQNYYNDSTHSYTLTLRNQNNNRELNYNGKLLWTDKTRLFQKVSTYRACPSNLIYQDDDYCYMTYQNVGFEFKIALSDLERDTTYITILKMHSKTINVGYQTKIFAPSIRQYQEKDGIRYELYSDYSTTHIVQTSDMLFVKAGPSVESARVSSWHYCSLTGYTLYWQQWGIFTSLQETAKTSNSYDAETWFRVMFNQGLCEGGRSRAYMGWSYSGWMPSVYTDFSGTPAVIKITTQKYASVDEIKTYTAPKNTNTKVKLRLYNNKNQTNNIKLYHNNNLVYNENITFNGEKEIQVNFKILNKGNVKAVITEPSGYVSTLEAPIYISDNSNYESKNNELIINPSTPIIVIADKTGTKNIYERIKITIPNQKRKIISGQSISAWSYIEYVTDNNEIILNSDINGIVYFPTQEKTLNYPLENNRVKVVLEKIDNSPSQLLLNLPEYILNKKDGSVYQNGREPKDIKIINGGRKWYVPINSNIGTYDYQIIINNVGVNKVSVKFNCEYEVIKKLLGNINSLYQIKRVKVPQNLTVRFSKVYLYHDLMKVGG
ncbi:MAG: hypothetical protein PHR25_02105 [Clostridia bacterium]|nr:hypothetical protein [Clostridia bacterium]